MDSASQEPIADTGGGARPRWMAVLARATRDQLAAALAALSPPAPAHQRLRGPETGLVMVRGRAGGTGERFNLGEMSVTRCTVALEGRVGHAYVAGTDVRRAELAAVLDALMQDPGRCEEIVWLSTVLYYFESNVRSATILGVVGAGGIGHQLSDRIRVNDWDQVAFIVLLILATVAVIDTLSRAIRRQALGERAAA